MSTTINLPDPSKLRERIIECARELALLKSIEKALAKARSQGISTREDCDDSEPKTT
ncbi:hypothetical protein SH449x_001710 [Pirellulaceae bacterium SH449]